MAELSFLETDSSAIHNKIINALESEVNEPLYPGDERRIFGDGLVAVLVATFATANEACKEKMLKYAKGEVLDALGERYRCDRLPPIAAKTTIRFAVNETIDRNIIIPKGTRVTPDNEVYFQTVDAAVLQAGSYSVTVPAECLKSGATYNGYSAGTIKQLVDLIPYIDTVENTVETFDGDDGEPYPEVDGGVGDDHYRERIGLAPTSLTSAGPSDAYEYYAKSADSSIADVAVISDEELITKTVETHGGYAFIGGRDLLVDTLTIKGCTKDTDYTVDYSDKQLLVITFKEAKASADISIKQTMACKVLIVPILKNGEIPDQEILDKVAEVCSADDVRPMTDLVEVRAPEQIPYDISLTYYVEPGDESDVVESIEGSGGAIELYKEWQNTKMGRDINPDKLRAMCLAPSNGKGCTRIIVNEPTYKELSNTQVAKFSGNLTINHIVEG